MQVYGWLVLSAAVFFTLVFVRSVMEWKLYDFAEDSIRASTAAIFAALAFGAWATWWWPNA